MASKRVKVKEHENLSDSNIKKVMELLNHSSPITKKEACEILNISYNTTRLSNIIEGYKNRKAIEKRQRDKKRGKPVEHEEKQEMAKLYLEGHPVSDIAKSLYRSTGLVKATIDKLGVPTKTPFDQRRYPAVLPDQCLADTFYPGQYAWSAVYHAPCEVIREVDEGDYQEKYSAKCYQIYVYEPVKDLEDIYPNITKGGFYAYSLAYNLGSLEHLKELGVTISV